MILVIQNRLPHYRREFFNELSKLDDVVVVHSSQPSSVKGDKFREKILRSIKVGPFVWQCGLSRLIKSSNPSAVIASADIRNVHSVFAMLHFDRKVRWIWWGMDRGASDLAFKLKCLLASRRNPIVFYNNEIRKIFLNEGIDSRRLFVANNTYHVAGSKSLSNVAPKDIFLNVGTLDTRKQNDVVIRAFNEIYRHTGKNLYLYLIGEGVARDSLEALVLELNLTDRVFLPGKIEDPHVLEGYYARALASVSFGQAGLAVLQSMAFGVPFITKHNAISGGEKYNIIDGNNGIFCSDDMGSLVNAMAKLIENPDYARLLGLNAFAHYREKASVVQMVDGFRSALEGS
jgi:glycosyltransferase involved in cell wall biosynthesis